MKDRSIEPDLGERTLQAFHDGELSRLARWRFERRLVRSAELRSELQALESVSELVRAGAAGVAVMGAVMRSETPGQVIADLIAALAAVAPG